MTMRRSKRRRGEAGLAELLEHHLRHVQRRVEAHEVEESERTHRVAASELHRLVDVLLRGHARLEQPDRLEEVRHEEPVDDEPRGVLGGDGCLAERLDEGPGGLEGRVPREDRADDLDQLHHRRRVEEVEPENLRGPPRRGGQLGDRARRGVRRQDGLRRADPVEARERLLLDAGFSVIASITRSASAEVLEPDGPGEPPPGGVALVGPEPPLVDQRRPGSGGSRGARGPAAPAPPRPPWSRIPPGPPPGRCRRP